MPRIKAKGPRGDSRRALEVDRVSEALINSQPIKPGAATQAALHPQLDHALAVHSGRACIGYVLTVDRAVVALDHDGIEIGRYESRRLAFATVTETHLAAARAP